ncbi:MAG TPA: hypothetical protein DCY00_06235, partial [Actinobacteria bacterium]|nr:hypothetical protein [Actinomycetota bacterium]
MKNRQNTNEKQQIDFILEAVNIGTWSINIDTRTACSSQLHSRILGYDKLQTEWSLEKFLNHIHPEDRSYMAEQIQNGI